MFIVLMVATISAMVFVARWNSIAEPWRSIVLVLLITSETLWGMARIQLGTAFAIRAVGRSLVRRGIYAYVRNPIYIFGGITAVCLVLFLNPYVALVFALLQIPIQYRRMRREEAALLEVFGDEYRAYRTSTWI